jgi:hypothetical protein
MKTRRAGLPGSAIFKLPMGRQRHHDVAEQVFLEAL